MGAYTIKGQGRACGGRLGAAVSLMPKARVAAVAPTAEDTHPKCPCGRYIPTDRRYNAVYCSSRCSQRAAQAKLKGKTLAEMPPKRLNHGLKAGVTYGATHGPKA